MGMQTEAAREYWRGVLASGGFTAIPRWTHTPGSGVVELEETVPGDLAAQLRGWADELGVSLSALLLAAHAKVLAALSGEAEPTTGYVARYGGPALPCRVTTAHASWRALVLHTARVESDLLAHQDFPVDDVRPELGLTEPFFETVLDPTGTTADLGHGTVLWV